MEMEEGRRTADVWDGYFDWRNRPAVVGRHGGKFPALFVLAVEVLENLAYLSNASNLVTYMSEYMHLSPSTAANHVTNFMGTAFLLALLGGFLSDAFFTTYVIFLMSAVIEFLGLVILTVQAKIPSLKPPPCDMTDPAAQCQAVSGGMAALLFAGLYIVALGVGGIKGSLPSHGAEQFDESTPEGRNQRSTFFNYFVFCLSCSGLIAVTLVVWVEDNRGWQWGFGIATLAILLSIPVFLASSTRYRNKTPTGSPLTTISKVLVAAVVNACSSKNTSNAIASLATSPAGEEEREDWRNAAKLSERDQLAVTASLKFLNRAATMQPVHKSLQSTVREVEETKIVLKILPIFASTIMLNCCLAQLSTFSIQQASTMDTKIGTFKVPPASLPIFPVLFIMVIAPIYDHFLIPLARKVTKTEMGISHLKRIGVGLALSVLAMAVAALVEIKRKRVALRDPIATPLPISFLWIAFQYLFLGSADLFTLAGLLDFFFSEAPSSMRSLATSLSWASLAVGYYLSSVIVSVVNDATRGGSGRRGWLSGEDLNEYRLERFYWLMCALSGLNLLNYLFWATRYKYRSRGAR
ncbi:hypothetical protein MLD38_002427 [Melastoma candidum]|uniref:Uncharacterized protein n=3 Tax=Melastoma candidum TaxID=119954 RepID=A0ACB9RZI5_9MYRT|nr:hypothetical protein MLD38_002427 [Melastoma candidum]